MSSILSNKSKHYLFTSESVGEGHPDKLCDQVSDAILDYCLSLDKDAHVACETFSTTNFLLVGGEIGFQNIKVDDEFTKTFNAQVEKIARQVARLPLISAIMRLKSDSTVQTVFSKTACMPSLQILIRALLETALLNMKESREQATRV